jgi:NADH dehydrogenase
MNKTLNIVILGAGYGGVHAAKILGKKYKKDANVKA